MRTIGGLVGVILVLAGMAPRAAALRLEDPDTLLAPKAALAEPTVLLVGPGEVGTDRSPDLAISVDGAAVRPALARRRLGGRWVWAITIPARAGTVVVTRADRWGPIVLARFPIVDRVAAPRFRWAAMAFAGDDVIDQWRTCRRLDGRDVPTRELTDDAACLAPGLEAFRASGEVVRIAAPARVPPLAFATRPQPVAHRTWAWLVTLAGVAVVALGLARRRRRATV